MKNSRYYIRAMAAGLLAAGLAAVGQTMAPVVSAQAVAQSYTADAGTMAAMIVQVDDRDKQRVNPASKDRPDGLYGVVVLPNDAPLSLSNATEERQVYVATSGTYRVLVSDENGPIGKDDFITVSSVDGVGMNAGELPNLVAAKALTGFDGKNDVKSQSNVKDLRGNERTVHFGYVVANISITRNPLARDHQDNLPAGLRQLAEGLADKPLTAQRIYISLAVMLLTAIIAVTVLTTGIRAGVIALGRNPLARKNIFRNLVQVVLVGLIILIVGLFAVYLILKL